ncbi:MAG TPA: glycosyltransferase family 2 protein, partial [Longimicrobiales bacterium]|nr:glycosyltransferase family 2 protein [Longimicrobiales bacterium]
MSRRGSRSVLVLGMMTKMPVPGVIWQTVHYLVGLRRLGYEVTYVEAHARTPSMFVRGTPDMGTRRAAQFIREVLDDFGLGDRWAFHALHHDGSCLGMDRTALLEAYRSADMIINLCGGTQPLPEHAETGRLCLVMTDPVQVEIELWQGRQETRDFLDAHATLFTFGENYGKPGCGLPVSPDYELMPTRQPVVLDFWENDRQPGDSYTTVANWHQPFRNLRYKGDSYFWSKDLEFRKFLELPERSGRSFELALASFGPEDRELLEAHGWMVSEADAFGLEAEPYRTYVQGSRGEFTVAKDQNVRLRSGWFSDRSATYLAAGRPVVTQDTGFDVALPTGAGLFAVADLDQAVEAVASIESDPCAARNAARDIARGYFDYRIVLPRMLADAGLEGPSRRFAFSGSAPRRDAIPEDLVLEPVSRRPLRLAPETERFLNARPVPDVASPGSGTDGEAPPETVSIVVVTYGNLALTRLCVESLLAHTLHPAYELVIVDNASTDGTPDYLRKLAAAHGHVRVILNPTNEGFPAACNQGARASSGGVIVFLNNDTVVAPGWLTALVAPLRDPALGAVNPVTNRIGTPAEVGAHGAGTYGAFLKRAAERSREQAGVLRPVRMLALFCMALRRETWDRVGALDEGFETGLFEDDDYSFRLGLSGLGMACAEGVLVHHFGEASFGDLVPDGRYGSLYRR